MAVPRYDNLPFTVIWQQLWWGQSNIKAPPCVFARVCVCVFTLRRQSINLQCKWKPNVIGEWRVFAYGSVCLYFLPVSIDVFNSAMGTTKSDQYRYIYIFLFTHHLVWSMLSFRRAHYTDTCPAYRNRQENNGMKTWIRIKGNTNNRNLNWQNDLQTKDNKEQTFSHAMKTMHLIYVFKHE